MFCLMPLAATAGEPSEVLSYDVVYRGRDTAIRGMYERLFARYASVWHGDFDHVVDPGPGASRLLQMAGWSGRPVA